MLVPANVAEVLDQYCYCAKCGKYDMLLKAAGVIGYNSAAICIDCGNLLILCDKFIVVEKSNEKAVS